jgi:uncharacterized sulfatase
MDRRDFLKKVSAGSLGLAMTGPLAATEGEASTKPNILFIMVDQMRFPSVFPAGVSNADQFLKKFMPNVYRLWKRGVKFGQHFGGATACTPSRGVIISGLYSQQSWLAQTITSPPNVKVSISPILSPVYPTYGKLLREAGYQTPYFGKWHVSLGQLKNYLEPYGFTGMTQPDPTGNNLQGTVGDPNDGYLSDSYVANQAAAWLSKRRGGDQPWCASVCFVNPHDHEFFWGGTEFETYNDLFNAQSTYQPFTFYSTNKGTNYPPVVSWADDIAKSPPSYGYPAVPPNWETSAHLKNNKPKAHSFIRTFAQFVWGGINEDTSQTKATITPYPGTGAPGYGIGLAPYSYWRRNLDSYTQMMTVVDENIGTVVDALPPRVAASTIVVFTSDHGDYVGSHGIPISKMCTAYDECIHMPLVVVDPTNRFAGDIDTVRGNLTSHVDMLNLLVSLGNNGSQKWMTGDYKNIYGGRHNMIPMLKSASAPGRDYVLFATDEMAAPQYVYNDAGLHVTAMRTKAEKIATYAKWLPLSTTIKPGSVEYEFYDYSLASGRAETHSMPKDSRVPGLVKKLEKLVATELRKPLPGKYGVAQKTAHARYIAFVKFMNTGKILPGKLKQILGFGQDF